MAEQFNWAEWWAKEKEKKAEVTLDQEDKEIKGIEEPDASTEDFFYTPDSESKNNKNYKINYDLQINKAQRLYPNDVTKQQNYLEDWKKREEIQREYAEQF